MNGSRQVPRLDGERRFDGVVGYGLLGQDSVTGVYPQDGALSGVFPLGTPLA